MMREYPCLSPFETPRVCSTPHSLRSLACAHMATQSMGLCVYPGLGIHMSRSRYPPTLPLIFMVNFLLGVLGSLLDKGFALTNNRANHAGTSRDCVAFSTIPYAAISGGPNDLHPTRTRHSKNKARSPSYLPR
ncbi:hypothetical protein BDV10DRAFT_166712 [Aspergillus recurvatus]